MTDAGVSGSLTRGPTWARDELILACDLVYENGWKGLDANDERVHRLSGLLQKMPIHPLQVRGPKFRNPNGVARKTYDLATHHPDYRGVPTKGGAGDLEVLEDFLDDGPQMHRIAQVIREGIDSSSFNDAAKAADDIDELETEAREGRLLERRHFARERDRKMRARKIQDHLKNHGNLSCSICDFDFREAHGPHGDGYIECHHVVPAGRWKSGS
jgi:5-methylcytosine-specific restriction protein A